ncbi:hypothetical protein NECAME_14832 [Necator americanus]|uniref:MSP domain-containing protein n=1 Tax=Necator americanus TaxID=51031 RepID=W2SL03_NECAM|nr:hypothetical protein NECAME_14832 [Necator americanus]ETN70339.1 hypothetical protein NECAME_14832 [Necator americanus]
MDGVVCFQNPRLPLLIKSGVTRHWMSNLSDRALNYKLTLENPDSCFSIDPGQISGEIPAHGHISIIITRKPGVGKEDKLTIEYTGELTGKTVVRMVPVA